MHKPKRLRPKRFKKDDLRKGIYILPNLITSLNIFCGFYALIASIDGNFHDAAIAIIIAVIFDSLDGKIARATNTSSRFGIEYDSLADMVSFGLAPGVMVYLWALKPLGRVGWLAGFLFMVCGALRLARFNSRVDSVPSEYFQGLPIPGAAGMTATTVWLCTRFDLSPYKIIVLVFLYLLSFLMVSTIKFTSFKKAELFKRMNFNILVWLILVLIFIATLPPLALFLIMLIYVLSGPIMALRTLKEDTLEVPHTETAQGGDPENES